MSDAKPRRFDAGRCRTRPRGLRPQVMAEIAEEVRLRRASGDLPPRLERELDELFLAHSPIGVRGGDLGEAIRMVDAATFIDPVVPVDSERAAGAVVKKGMRTMLLWYVGWVTHQMSQSASAVSRALHIVDDHLKELERKVESQRIPDADVVEFPSSAGPGSGGGARTGRARKDTRARPPRRLRRRLAGQAHRRVRRGRLRHRPAHRRSSTPWSSASSTCAARTVLDHLRAVAAGRPRRHRAQRDRRGDGGRRAQPASRRARLDADPGGTLVIHSVERELWDAPDAPYGADLAAGRPLRADTWCRLLEESGYTAEREHSPDGTDYLVTAVRGGLTPFDPADPARGEHATPPGGRWRSTSSSPPSIRTTRPAPTRSSCATSCARRGGARRSSPRRSTTTWPPRRTSTGCTPSTRRPVTSPSTSSRRRRPSPRISPSTGSP